MILNFYGRIIRINSNDFKYFLFYNLCVYLGCVIVYYKYFFLIMLGVFVIYIRKMNEECGVLCMS